MSLHHYSARFVAKQYMNKAMFNRHNPSSRNHCKHLHLISKLEDIPLISVDYDYFNGENDFGRAGLHEDVEHPDTERQVKNNLMSYLLQVIQFATFYLQHNQEVNDDFQRKLNELESRFKKIKDFLMSDVNWTLLQGVLHQAL